ncbi:hypothetical protein [Corallibacter sp.]|uniref:hypothetical protein n=1 Tax=Corallibacter sp. TaxID=2038084 RepID=UPI003A95948F
MKKQLLLIITLLFACASRAQVYTINSELKLNNVTQADASDSLLVWDNDGRIKFLSSQSLFENIKQVDDYEDIPFKPGVYKVNNGISDLETNLLNYDGSGWMTVSEVMVDLQEEINTSVNVYVKREYNGYNEAEGYPSNYYKDVVYYAFFSRFAVTKNYKNIEVGEILLTSESPSSSALNYYGKLLVKRDRVEYLGNLPGYKIGEQLKNNSIFVYNDYLNFNYDEVTIKNGLIITSLTRDLNKNITEFEVIIDNQNFSNCQLAYYYDEDADETYLTIKDLTGLVAKNLKYFKSLQIRIKDNRNASATGVRSNNIPGATANTFENVLLYEAGNDSHTSAMVSTFTDIYDDFSGSVLNSVDDDISDFYSYNYIQQIEKNDVDFAFSAGDSWSTLRGIYTKRDYSVVPLGSNDLTRQDITSSINEFLPNAIIVTSRSETDNDGSDPLGSSYGFGVEFNEPTLGTDLTAAGVTTSWGGTSEHQQSPAVAIVAAKLKKIKDLSNAPWDIVRESARETASNAGSYNIYRGFGVIDTTAAIALAETKLIARSQELGEYYESISPFPQELKFEDKGPNTQVVKKDLDEYDDFLRLSTPYTDPAQTVNGSVVFADDAKLSFGNQYQLWSNGSEGRLTLLSGDLSIRDGATEKWKFEKATGNFEASGDVIMDALYLRVDQNNSIKKAYSLTSDEGLRVDIGISAPNYFTVYDNSSVQPEVFQIEQSNGLGGDILMRPDGNVGIGLNDPSEKLEVLGNVKANQYKLSSLNTAPSSATDTGTVGEIRITSDYIYVCISTDTWVRAELNTWP